MIDDYIAADSNGNSLFMKPSPHKELWPILLEKALAKLFGNYDMLIAGNSNDAIASLMGYPGDFFLNSSKDKATLFATIQSNF